VLAREVVAGVALLLLLIPDLAWGAAARNGSIPVSPGSLAGQASVPGHCPTFSWAPAGEVDAYEVRVYRTPAPAEELAGVVPALSARVPGTASSWTPAQPSCLEEGADYSWTVVPLDGADMEGEAPVPLSFRVASGSLSPAAAGALPARLTWAKLIRPGCVLRRAALLYCTTGRVPGGAGEAE